MSHAPPALEVRQLTKRFGHLRALRSVDLAVGEGEMVVLFGPNGAGKTTLLRVMASLTRPTSGDVRAGGRPVSDDVRGFRRRLGHVSHQSMLYDSLSPRENLCFAGRMHGVDRLRARVDQILDELDLTERAGDPVSTLSRGMQQRVSVARALLHDPEVILLDEPFNGLDQHASRVLSSLLSTVRKRGRTVLMVTHDLARGLEMADRAVILVRGRVAFDSAVAGLSVGAFEETYLRCVGGGMTASVVSP